MNNKYILAIAAFMGLLFSFLSSSRGKATVQKVSTLEGEVGAHEEQADIHLAESAKEMNEAKESQAEAADISESITGPRDEVKSGHTRKSFKSS